MIPPLLRRCPDCGHTGRTGRFSVVGDWHERRLECPVCGHRFEPVDKPWLQ